MVSPQVPPPVIAFWKDAAVHAFVHSVRGIVRTVLLDEFPELSSLRYAEQFVEDRLERALSRAQHIVLYGRDPMYADPHERVDQLPPFSAPPKEQP